MSMRKELVKGISHMGAPKGSFSARHPRRAAMTKAATWTARRVIPSRRRHDRTRMALKGIGAAAVALPIGVWLGRRMWPSRSHQTQYAGLP